MKLKVGGMSYEIIRTNDLELNGDRNLWGYCDLENTTIFIKESLSIERQKQVLIHELTHAIFHEAGIEDDEDTVNKIGILLHQVLLDNKFNDLLSCD